MATLFGKENDCRFPKAKLKTILQEAEKHENKDEKKRQPKDPEISRTRSTCFEFCARPK